MTLKETDSLELKLLKDYDMNNDMNGISGERLAHRLGEISKIGPTSSHGSNRPGYSREEKKAKELVGKWMSKAGLTVYEDGAGNLFGRLAGKNDSLPAVLCGSHVDSVPNGGHFDGPLGVLAALEVVEAWKEIGYQPEKPFEMVIFSDEEGARFNSSFSGSEAVIGKGNLEEKLQLKDAEGSTFEQVLNDVGLTVNGYSQAKRDMNDVELFIEVHIEQGKRLEEMNLPCGIVTGIAGPCWLAFTFHGDADHAGNTPMGERKDALVAASEFIVEVSKLPSTISDSAVATVGKQQVEPNGVNVIPGKVTLYVDVRDIFEQPRDELVDQVKKTSIKLAKKYNIEVDSEEIFRVAPVPIQEELQQLLEKSIHKNEMKIEKLPSGAGHDAMILGEKVPIAMLFVRSKNGISHHPNEWSDLNDCVLAVHVLKDYLEEISQSTIE